MNLKDFQIEKIEELFSFTKDNYEQSNKTAYLRAPTGSGKTIILGNYIKKVISSETINNLCFVWASPGPKLVSQSKNKIDGILDSISSTKTLNDISHGNSLNNKEIVFFNWEKVIGEDTLINQENESGYFIKQLFEDIRNKGFKIVLIADEAHKNLNTELNDKLIEKIKPNIFIYASATPDSNIYMNADKKCDVSLSDVIKTELIKKSLIIDDSFTQIQEGNLLEKIISSAVKKRNELEKCYKKEKKQIKPVCIIQLPNVNAINNIELRDIEDVLKNKFNITVDNKKLAIHLNNIKTHENIDEISSDQNVEFIIFKLALSFGWDCPRAQILVLFRDTQVLSLKIQTFGRVIRMPEPKKYGYSKENEILNHSYLITNLSNINYDRDVAGYINQIEANLNPILLDFFLPIYRIKKNSLTTLDTIFDRYFLKLAHEQNLKDKLKFKNLKVVKEFLDEGNIKNIDRGGTLDKTDKMILTDKMDIKREAEYFVYSNLNTRLRTNNSINVINQSLYAFLEKENIEYKNLDEIIADDENKSYISQLINLIQEKILSEQVTKVSKNENWKFKDKEYFKKNYEQIDCKKYAYDKFYLNPNFSTPEKKFIKFLEENAKVEWWFKNNDSGEDYFSIPYQDDVQKYHQFFIDFIIKTKKGIFLLDTKARQTINTATCKVKGLNKYIDSFNKEKIKPYKLFGGIVATIDNDETWVFSDKPELMSENKVNSWTQINEIL